MLSGYHSLPCYSYIFFLFLVIVILLLSLLLLLVQHCDYCRLSLFFSVSRSSFFPRSLPSFSSPFLLLTLYSPFFSLLSLPHSSLHSLLPFLLSPYSITHTQKKIVLLFSLPCLPPLFLPLPPYPAPPTHPPTPSHPSLCALKNLMECSTERSGWSARRPIYHARVMLSRSIASQMYSGPRK